MADEPNDDRVLVQCAAGDVLADVVDRLLEARGGPTAALAYSRLGLCVAAYRAARDAAPAGEPDLYELADQFLPALDELMTTTIRTDDGLEEARNAAAIRCAEVAQRHGAAVSAAPSGLPVVLASVDDVAAKVCAGDGWRLTWSLEPDGLTREWEHDSGVHVRAEQSVTIMSVTVRPTTHGHPRWQGSGPDVHLDVLVAAIEAARGAQT